MSIPELIAYLLEHPLIASALVAWLLCLLHIPYRYDCKRDTKGREHGIWQSIMYRYAYGPDYERFDYRGLYRLQRCIVDMVRLIGEGLRESMFHRLITELRQRLSL